jgi:bifunctional non-homologous end joining protein LigD
MGEEHLAALDVGGTAAMPAGEPLGEAPAGDSSGPVYIIHKHDASRLHYDLRLECDGALLSWAVPKGPSLDPAHKRLAVMVEEHELDCADFEGAIPQGEYGGGTVMVWDVGTFGHVGKGSMRQAAEEGCIEFRLHGCKLRGLWKLVRTNWGAGNNWLLIKKTDDYADRTADVTTAMPDSALTGRSMEEIGRQSGGA